MAAKLKDYIIFRVPLTDMSYTSTTISIFPRADGRASNSVIGMKEAKLSDRLYVSVDCNVSAFYLFTDLFLGKSVTYFFLFFAESVCRPELFVFF